jgi:hypothetical protein
MAMALKRRRWSLGTFRAAASYQELISVTEISLCVAGLCGTATHGPCVLVTASLTAFRTAVSILGQAS